VTFHTTILGCGAALPTKRNNPSSQVVNVHDKLFLVDCGEGTQVRMRDLGVKFQKINHVFISHLHGDHYLGIFGYISSMHLLGRKPDLHIYGSADLEQLVRINLRLSHTFLSYELIFHELQFKTPEKIFEDRTVEVVSFPLKHRIECAGFLFREKPLPRNVKKSALKMYDLQPTEIVKLKRGETIRHISGQQLTQDDACEPQRHSRSYAYCSDTAYNEKMVETIAGVNLIYHEATFLEKDKKRAKETFHSTAKQAAMIAQKARAGKLLLGHFSSRYSNPDDFATEASEVFPATEIATEGQTYLVL